MTIGGKEIEVKVLASTAGSLVAAAVAFLALPEIGLSAGPEITKGISFLEAGLAALGVALTAFASGYGKSSETSSVSDG
jgi:hypothetical protein